MRPRKNFTLVELLVVITLIGILVAFLLPARPPYDHPLHTALRYGNAIEARRLIENGLANVNEQGYRGWTPLHYAAMGGHKAVAVLLIEKGADVNGRDTRRSTPLHSACISREAVANYDIKKGPNVEASRDVAELLIEKGADVNAKNYLLMTPLHSAANYSSLDVAKLLLRNGADVNAKDNCLETPLHLAARSGQIEFVGLLLSQGADLNPTNRGGYTPLSCAEDAGRREISALLIAKGAIRSRVPND